MTDTKPRVFNDLQKDTDLTIEGAGEGRLKLTLRVGYKDDDFVKLFQIVLSQAETAALAEEARYWSLQTEKPHEPS